MFYTTETGRQHATTYFNRTIDIVEPHTWVDFQGIFLFILILAAIGGLGTFLPPFLPLFPISGLSCLSPNPGGIPLSILYLQPLAA